MTILITIKGQSAGEGKTTIGTRIADFVKEEFGVESWFLDEGSNMHSNMVIRNFAAKNPNGVIVKVYGYMCHNNKAEISRIERCLKITADKNPERTHKDYAVVTRDYFNY